MVKGTTKSKGTKNKLDKFYTKPKVANYFIQKVNKLYPLTKYNNIIEPSAGNGAFSKNLSKYLREDGNKFTTKIYAYDLLPEDDAILKADWLKLSKEDFKGKSLVIGNPPFGNKSSLAFKFIEESCKFAETVAFILPKGCKKISFKNRIPLNYWLVYEEDVPKKSFTLDGEDYNVPCVFQIWVKRSTERKKVIYKKESKYIKFSVKEDADFRIQRIGYSAGKAFKNLDVSKSSNYFVKNISNFSTEDLISAINKLSYPTLDDTTGPRSISKGELIKELEDRLG